MPMENSFSNLKIDSLTHPGKANPLEAEWRLRAEEELNETQENYHVEMQTLRAMVLKLRKDPYFLEFFGSLYERGLNVRRCAACLKPIRQVSRRTWAKRILTGEYKNGVIASSLMNAVLHSMNQTLVRRERNEQFIEEHMEARVPFGGGGVTVRGVMRNDDANLRVPNSDEFLLRFLRARKFDSKKAFQMLQRYYLMKLKCPELFGCPAPSECSKTFDLQAQNMLLHRDQWGRRVFVIRVDNFDSSKVTIEDIFRTNVLALEHIVREPETQIAGLVVILDMSGLSLQHAKFFTPYYGRKMVELVQETFPLRFKGFHVVNEPFFFDAVMTVLKPFLKDKIKKRIFLHGNDLNALQAFVSCDVLPTEYGGNAGNFDNKTWYMQLLADEEYFKDLNNYGYINENTGE